LGPPPPTILVKKDQEESKNGEEEKEGKEEKKENGEKEGEQKKLLPEGWNFHAQTTIIPNFHPGFGASTPVPTAWTRAANAGERLPRTLISACRYGTVPSFTRICLCGRASA
jgi:hypothetical protein